MTNAIEQTRREMHAKLKFAWEMISPYSLLAARINDFESVLEAHLEALRKESANQQSRLELNESLANGFSDQVATANKINTGLIEQRDTLRNRLQAFEMASQTSAEIIKRLRAKLDSAKFGVNCTVRPDEQASKNEKAAALLEAATLAQGSRENASSAKTDPYTLGYSSVGKCSNPFPINTVERLHWNDGARDRMSELGQRS